MKSLGVDWHGAFVWGKFLLWRSLSQEEQWESFPLTLSTVREDLRRSLEQLCVHLLGERDTETYVWQIHKKASSEDSSWLKPSMQEELRSVWELYPPHIRPKMVFKDQIWNLQEKFYPGSFERDPLKKVSNKKPGKLSRKLLKWTCGCRRRPYASRWSVLAESKQVPYGKPSWNAQEETTQFLPLASERRNQ